MKSLLTIFDKFAGRVNTIYHRLRYPRVQFGLGT